MFQDTYFLSSQEALKVASMQNKPTDITLQLCYYGGEKITSDFVNLVYLPLDDFVNTLAKGTYRLPSTINFDGMDLSEEIKSEIEKNFYLLLEQARSIREELNMAYYSTIKKTKLNFNEPLRFYLTANKFTQVMQYVSYAIAQTLEEMGYNVVCDVQYGIEDNDCLKNILLFKPHVTININAIRRFCIGDDVFNFVWFQDPVSFLTDGVVVQTHQRDFIFSLLPMFDKMLENKGISYQRQGFCVNDKIYKPNENIMREKKIVFIGSSYLKFVKNIKEEALDATKEVTKIFLEGKTFTNEIIKDIAKRYQMSINFVESRLIPYVVRDIGLIQLCSLDIDYEIEIYGWGWDVYEELQPYYKGTLEYGNEIAEVYNSAAFAFAPHQQYTLQQRTFEASACGAIPVVYDCRDISYEESYEEALCYYKTTNDLKKIFSTDLPKKDFSRLLKEHTYASFVKKLLKLIYEKI